MAKVLQNLLGSNDPLFAHGMHELEKSTGHSGVDIRLIADITQRAHHCMRELGLDPADSTAEEVFHALKASVRRGSVEKLCANSDFVLLRLPDGVVSFNAIDIIESAHHDLSFDQQSVQHARRSLRGEIVARYSSHERTNIKTVKTHAATAGVLQKGDATFPKTRQNNDKLTQPFILAVGDIFTDAFIKLREDYARIDTDPDGTKRLSLPFGSKPPYDRVDIVQAVGPSPNAAIAFSRLGLRSGLMAYLGDDQPGADSLEYLQKEGIDTYTVSRQSGTPSNYYYVLRYGADRTILVKNEAYDYRWQEPENVPDWIYLSLVSKDAWQLHEELLGYLEKHPTTKLAFQPGTFHFEWGARKLANVYKRSHIVIMNREEAVDVTGEKYESLEKLANALHALGPKIVVITDGPNGSYASHDGTVYSIPNYPDPAPPLDRTGAGDAFASTIVAALALGKSIDTALRWAPINSMSVVQKLGAQAGLLRVHELEKYLEKAPDTYRAKEL